MVARSIELVSTKAKRLLDELVGKSCTLQRVGSDRSLFLGFGEIDRARTVPHAGTEIGTYDCAWRICQNGKVICGRNDPVDDVKELQEMLSSVDLGEFRSISLISEYDVRIQFSTGKTVDVLCTVSGDDEVVHVFFPENEVLVFQPEHGWRFGRSDQPWN